MARTSARVEGTTLVAAPGVQLTADAPTITVGTPAWFAWLEDATSFTFTNSSGSFTARKERRARGGWYWKAYRTVSGKLNRAYLGKTEDLTLDRLNHAAAMLARASVAPDARAVAPLPPPAAAIPLSLLTTKLFVPPARATLIPRPRLFDRIQSGVRGKLTLIAAPAGFGKTTLVSGWHASAGTSAPPLAWVSLDPTDNDPLRFWSYVLAALDTVTPGVVTAALSALQSPQPPPIDTILTNVLNAFARIPRAAGHLERDIALVLEDYHVITAPAIHDALAWLLDYLPPHLHLVIVTRADPPLPLARLRASGSVTELHADDLRFSPDEVAAFLNQAMGLALTPGDLAALEARTEGWIAGLQLAALALREHRDRPGFIRTFTGSNRYIVDYLAAEVFARQPVPIQTFLLHTAILDRMCAPLCDAILDLPVRGEGSAVTLPPPSASALDPASFDDASSQHVLAVLERSNLFVVPLDDDRTWYRYHHLFADVLRQQLARGATGAAVATMHARASEWYEQQGLVAEAVRHALAAADEERVARLIEQHGLGAMLGGQMSSVLGWLHALNDDLIRARPLLCLVHASALRFTNQSEAAEARLQDAERCIQHDTPPEQAAFIRGRIASIRANIARYTGDLAGCVAFAQQALQLLPESQVVPRTFSELNVVRAFRVTGDVTDATERRAVAVIAPIRASGNLLGTLVAVANLAWLQVLQGRLRAAAATYHEMIQISSGRDKLNMLLGGVAYYAGIGDLLREWNDLDAAREHLAQAMELLQGTLTVDAEDVALAYMALARLQHADGDSSSARATLDTFTDLARRCGFVDHLIARGATLKAQRALTAGDLSVAVAWADASRLHAKDTVPFPREAEYLILARVWIAQAASGGSGSMLPQALHLLEQLLEDATAKARMSSVLEILIVRALACWAQGAREDALATIERALVLAEPEGYIRRFVDEGPVVAAMLRAVSPRRITPAYLARLLAAFSGGHGAAPGLGTGEMSIRAPQPAPMRSLYEAGGERLSQRELEVLRLMASGKSNAEIARVLVVAVSTVKSHTNSIFGKLEVASRGEAILRAREMHLL